MAKKSKQQYSLPPAKTPTNPAPVIAAVPASVPAADPTVDLPSPGDAAEPLPKIGPTVNPRNAVLASLHRQSLDETGNAEAAAMNPDETDVDDGAPRPNREAAAAAAAALANAAADVADDEGITGEPGTGVVEPPPTPVAKTHRVEVRGVVHEVPEDQLLQAGLHAMRHHGAAEMALREANELLKQAKTVTGTPATDPKLAPASDISDDARSLAEALQLGSKEDAARAVAAMLKGGHTDQAIQDIVARTVETHVTDKMEHDSASKALEGLVPEMLSDRRVLAILGHEERAARAAGDSRPYSQLYPEIGKKVRDWLDGLKGPAAATPSPGTGVPARTIEQRTAAKAATPAATPPRGAPPSASTQPKVRTGSEIVAEMRQRRGNPDFRYTRRI